MRRSGLYTLVALSATVIAITVPADAISASASQQPCTVLAKADTLAQALYDASRNDRDDVICLMPGRYGVVEGYFYGPASWDCDNKLTIRSEGGEVILDGGGSSARMLTVNSGGCSDDRRGAITIQGITFVNGGGVVVVTNSGSLTEHLTFS